MRTTLAAGLSCLLLSIPAWAANDRGSDPSQTSSSGAAVTVAQAASSSQAPAAKQISGAPSGTYGRSASLTFDYATTKVYGVSLGGWLVTEPWITPSIYDAAPSSAVDEYTLTQALGKSAAASVLGKHWATFIVPDADFPKIKAAGLTHVRIPVGYWMLDIASNEPFVNGQYPYLQQAVISAKNNGLKVTIDVHGAPLSQNGCASVAAGALLRIAPAFVTRTMLAAGSLSKTWLILTSDDNSGRRLDQPGWFASSSSVSRQLAVIQTLATEFRQSKYGGAVVSIEPLNEPKPGGGSTSASRLSVLQDFLSKAYAIVHDPAGPYALTFHFAFQGLPYWYNFMPKSSAFKDAIVTTHPYYIWNAQQLAYSDSQRIAAVCASGSGLSQASQYFTTLVAEWSPAMNDCTKYLRGRGVSANGNCADYTSDASKFSADYITRLGKFWEAQARTYSRSNGWLAWTWRTEAGAGEEWSYSKGLQYGWVPSNPTAYRYPDPC